MQKNGDIVFLVIVVMILFVAFISNSSNSTVAKNTTATSTVQQSTSNDRASTTRTTRQPRRTIFNRTSTSTRTTSRTSSTTDVAVIKLDKLSSRSGAVGATITITGKGFDAVNNSIMFGTTHLTNIASPDGKKLSFLVPSLPVGTYTVSVISSLGRSNTLMFTISSQGTRLSSEEQPRASIVAYPSTLQVNSMGIWVIQVDSSKPGAYTVSVNWGDTTSTAFQQTKSFYVTDRRTTNFTHTYDRTGTYKITYTVLNNVTGTEKTITSRVSVANTSNQTTSTLRLSGITPTKGAIGSQIIIKGKGFHPTNNTVHFANGGSKNVSSYNNGTLILYSIPSFVNSCEVVSFACENRYEKITPGRYSLYISNSLGQVTNDATVTVTE